MGELIYNLFASGVLESEGITPTTQRTTKQTNVIVFSLIFCGNISKTSNNLLGQKDTANTEVPEICSSSNGHFRLNPKAISMEPHSEMPNITGEKNDMLTAWFKNVLVSKTKLAISDNCVGGSLQLLRA